MDRRTFLRRTSIALAAGLVVGEEALEAFAKLTHQRKSFPVGVPYQSRFVYWDASIKAPPGITYVSLVRVSGNIEVTPEMVKGMKPSERAFVDLTKRWAESRMRQMQNDIYLSLGTC